MEEWYKLPNAKEAKAISEIRRDTQSMSKITEAVLLSISAASYRGEENLGIYKERLPNRVVRKLIDRGFKIETLGKKVEGGRTLYQIISW